MSFYRCGPTAVGSRASWGPVGPSSPPTAGKTFSRPISGNFDRIFNVFERSNAFEYVKSTESCTKETERRVGHTDIVTRSNSVTRSDDGEPSDDIAKKDNARSEAKSVDRPDDVGFENVSRNDAVARVDSATRSEALARVGGGLERADCALAACGPADDDEDFYREKILYSQARQLFPLQEDLADWINKTIGITYLTGENFLDVLDNGVELCQLAAVIQERAREALREGTSLGPVPSLRGRCWQRAARRSFFSRDNTENFITFCRELGVHENLLFESDDLVLHHQPRQVIVCLLEVARLAARLGLEPPGLVQLESEIAQEERDSALSDRTSTMWQFRDSTSPHSRKSIEAAPSSLEQNESGVSLTDNADAESTKSESTVASTDSDVPLRPTNELDKRVQLVTRLMERGCQCGDGKCSKLLKVKKVGEGRYNIAGRNVFIRLLKGRHMMVRVGGGWDTLEHFLSRHEPCQVRLVTAGRRALVPLPASPPPQTQPPIQHASSSSLSSKPSRTPSPGTVSPVDSKTSSLSGKVSPIERASSKASSGPRSPIFERRTSTPIKGSARSTRAGLTLPLKAHSVDQNIHKPTTPRGRKSSIPSTPTTPSTPSSRSGRATPADFRKSHTTTSLLNAPKKTRSMSLALSQKEDKFCGTDRLNQAKKKSASAATTPVEAAGKKVRSQSLATAGEPRKAVTPTGTFSKKTRSMSLVQPTSLRSLGKRSASAAAVGVTPITGLTQADIEESIRQSLAASIAEDCPNKPFLHIKAKYRSPPPREVPPR